MASQKTAGRNASVDERPGEGTVINFPDQTPSALPGCCPGNIMVEISGVLFDCGCIDTTSLGTSIHSVTVTGSIDGTYTMTLSGGIWSATGTVPLHYQGWSDVGCTGDPVEDETDITFAIYATCDSGDWNLFMISSVGAGNLVHFWGISSPSPVSNNIFCNEEISVPDPVGGVGMGDAASGTATISCL